VKIADSLDKNSDQTAIDMRLTHTPSFRRREEIGVCSNALSKSYILPPQSTIFSKCVRFILQFCWEPTQKMEKVTNYAIG